MPDHANINGYVALTFLLSVPFWIAGYELGGQFLPGLPISALMAFVPAIAASALTAQRRGWNAAKALVARVGDARRASAASLALAVTAMPALTFAAWLWMTISGVAMPAAEASFGRLMLLFGIFLPAALAEEVGWSGYVAEPALSRWGFLSASLTIGAVWAAWHLVPLIQAGRSWDWIFWWTLGTVSSRVIAMGVFEASNRSVFTVSVMHAAQNTAWQMFPNSGSHFDPAFAAPVFAGAACCTAMLAAWTVQRQ